MNDTIIRSRIDSAVKSEAVKIFNSMGLSMSDAIRLFLHQVISKQALPFPVEAPNNITVTAMKAARRGENLETITLQQLEKDWEEACGK